jgi:(p)ppGpp synthase/HD superfamily hydrolase
VGGEVLLVVRALEFVARRHSAQRRKGSAAEPYVNHLAEVARLLAEACAGGDPELVAAGLLHDTLEDTPTRPEELEREFGPGVLGLVREVTDDKRLPRQERKRLQVQTAVEKSARARMIKIADKVSNLRSLRSSPPLAWSRRRRLEYVRWAAQVVERCRGVSPELEQAFDRARREALAALGAPAEAEGAAAEAGVEGGAEAAR